MTPRRIALCLYLLLAVSAFAQTPKWDFVPGPRPGGGEVKITVAPGGEWETEKDEYSILRGDVTIEYQDIKLRADKVTYNLKTKDVVAEGNVIIDQGPTRISATQVVFNLESKIGTFFNANGTMDPSMYFSGDRIEKVDEDTYKLTNGVFTSCDLDRPAWSFHVGEAEVTLNDYAHLKNLSFRARNLPIFWAPRLVWPTKRERSKGFLIPRARFSDKFGARLEAGYFLPLGDSVDATMYADVSAKEYFGAGLDLRYVPSQNVEIGDLSAHAVNNAEDDQVEWKYQYRHAQENLPGGFRGVVDVQDYSNLDFFREYDDDPRLHTLSNIYSSAYLTKNRPTYSLNVLADRRDYELATGRQRYEQLPSLQLRMYPQRVGGTPLYFSMESSASHLRSGGLDQNRVATVDADYYRTDIFPTVSLKLRTPQWLSVKPQISVRETLYSASLQPVCDEGNPDRPVDCSVCETNPLSAVCNRTLLRDDRSIDRFYGQGQVEVVGPSFSRVFNRATGGFSRFKHVIEPRIRYVYTTDVENQKEIVRFDTVDSPFLPLVQDSVEYSLTQRLIGKEASEGGSAREILTLSLRQTVALSDPFTSRATTVATENKFTPLVATLRFNPYQSITLDTLASFGNVSHQLDQLSVSANLVGTGEHSDKYLGFTYFSSFELPGSSAPGQTQIRLNTGSSLVRDRIRADVQLNYDAEDGKFLEQRYLTGWTGSCYGIALEYRRYLVYGLQDENFSSYGIAVTLKNVGTIGNR